MSDVAAVLARLGRRTQRRPTLSHFGLSCVFCRERHRRHYWLCFFILSILSSSACATAAPTKTIAIELQRLLKRINPPDYSRLEESDALLYTPTLNDIPENCEDMSLLCYMIELDVIIAEEELKTPANDLYHLLQKLPSQGSSVRCPPCEAQALEPAIRFLQNLRILLQYINSQQAKRGTL